MIRARGDVTVMGGRPSAGIRGGIALGVLLAALMLAVPVLARQPAARHKAGPVTLRGVAQNVRGSTFTLTTRTSGSYQVVTTANTHVTERGKTGRIAVRDGDHVGVRGFVQGRQIRAMDVRIYPTKPKAYDVRGVVAGVQGSRLTVSAGGKTVSIRLTSSTAIRIGSAPGTASQIRTGDRVQVRVQPGDAGLTALNVHVYRSKVPGRHVEIRGTISAVGGGSIGVRSGSTSYTVRLTGATVFYSGSRRSSIGALKVGEQVTVYACCAGQPLTATSVHIRSTPARRTEVLLRGRVVALSSSEIRLAISKGTVTIRLVPSTVYEVGSGRVGRDGVRIGDEVSVRAVQAGSALEAARVHVYTSYRRPRTVTGVVASVSRTGLVVVSGGKSVAVAVASGTAISLNGARIALTSLRSGDRVKVTASVTGNGVLTATRIVARRAAVKVKLQSLRGVIVQVGASTLLVADDLGARRQVRLQRSTQLRLQTGTYAASALFPGARVTVRGYMSGSVLVASSITVDVKVRTIQGRILTVGHSSIQLSARAGARMTVDLPPGAAALDGARRIPLSSLHAGAYLSVQGYEVRTTELRAVSIRVLHPSLDVSARVVSEGASPIVETS
ncbi:MAG: hypothetical protein JOZ41_17700, partial [Chloroflexi bacterium]|nr:hypothetical protein [Chloroflexota bacterium]